MDNRQILISGASIAGPALAYWLRRHNFFPTVVERAPAPREGGQAVDLRGAAATVVERMDLLDDIRRAHVGTRGMSYVDSTNKRLASMSADILGDSGGAIAELEIMRGTSSGSFIRPPHTMLSTSSTTPSPTSPSTTTASGWNSSGGHHGRSIS